MKPDEIKEICTAYVYQEKLFVGYLRRQEKGSFFEYDDSYLKDCPDDNYGIAFHLSTQNKRYESLGTNLHPFFAGLLPEGLRLQVLTRSLKTSADDLLSHLIAIGSDCIGDISISRSKKNL